uniref:Uncharacterized protein n=1 Tax=Dunaliella tertiolecta TaxID=3047 RepID=A0A7S3VHN0_DUNTE
MEAVEAQAPHNPENQEAPSTLPVYKSLHVDLGQEHEGSGDEGEAGGAMPRLTSPLKTSPCVNQRPFAPATHKVHHEVFTQDVSPRTSPGGSSPKNTLKKSQGSPNRLNASSTVHSPNYTLKLPGSSSSPKSLLRNRFSVTNTSVSPERSLQPSMRSKFYSNESGEHLAQQQLKPQTPVSPSRVLQQCSVPLPPVLSFESWWNEGKERMHVTIDFESATGICTASLNVAAQVHRGPSFGQTPIEPWDLHVGAQLRLLGRRMTLQKARDAQTLQWLDAQAFLLRRVKEQFEQQLSKFRLVGSYTRDRGPRCEGIDSVCHASTPTGGRANLRNLRDDIVDLAIVLREHQLSMPLTSLNTERSTGLPSLLSPMCARGDMLTGTPSCFSQSWSPERWRAEDLDCISKAGENLADGMQSSRAEVLRRDFMNWIVNIPLAASAARLEKQGQHYMEPSIPTNVARQQVRQSSGKTAGRPSLSTHATDGARKGLTLDLQMFPQHKAPPEEKSHRSQEDGTKGRAARPEKQQAKSSNPNPVKQGSPEIPQPARPGSRRFSNSLVTPPQSKATCSSVKCNACSRDRR